MRYLVQQIRNAVDKPEVDLGIGSCRPDGSPYDRNFSNKENVLLCLDMLEAKHASIGEFIANAKARIGCGVTTGHGERCVAGYSCNACSSLKRLIDDVESVLRGI